MQCFEAQYNYPHLPGGRHAAERGSTATLVLQWRKRIPESDGLFVALPSRLSFSITSSVGTLVAPSSSK